MDLIPAESEDIVLLYNEHVYSEMIYTSEQVSNDGVLGKIPCGNYLEIVRGNLTGEGRLTILVGQQSLEAETNHVWFLSGVGLLQSLDVAMEHSFT